MLVKAALDARAVIDATGLDGSALSINRDPGCNAKKTSASTGPAMSDSAPSLFTDIDPMARPPVRDVPYSIAHCGVFCNGEGGVARL